MNKVDMIPQDLAQKIIHMYEVDMLTLQQIEDRTGIKWWTINSLLEKNNIKKISLSERAKIKREKDFDLIYKLHFVEEMSVKDIYKKYKFSPPYVRQVLKDKGLKPINRGKFLSQKNVDKSK
ncbi:hypothetical protein [Tepidanaerobacter acetatoxydans]|uniref:hypothetical protein n=1 Tax=Tepidanaerobacter acetatoxydans TaxID=499229 RepID=UPI0026F307B4|nr:hypothetical protein [Tepidanaerobacter acetatoxydans]